MTIQDTLTFDVDLNDVDADGRLMASLRFGSSFRTPEPQERVFVRDDEGNGCWGYVNRIEDLIVYIDLARGTLTRTPQWEARPMRIVVTIHSETGNPNTRAELV